MTRGKLALTIDENGIQKNYISIEFNGDMYPDGHGKEVLSAYKSGKIATARDFERFVAGFNKRNFGYPSDEGYPSDDPDGSFVRRLPDSNGTGYTYAYDFVDAGYGNSDYTYWLNLSKDLIIFKASEGKVALMPQSIALMPQFIAIFHFTRLFDIIEAKAASKEDLCKRIRAVEEELRDIREELETVY